MNKVMYASTLCGDIMFVKIKTIMCIIIHNINILKYIFDDISMYTGKQMLQKQCVSVIYFLFFCV